MGLPRMGSPRGATSRRVALWSALAVGGILPSVGCQVEYAGMTLPSGKYMHDDVQYFPSGPEFPWANTQAATQRARMRAMGIEPPPPPAPFVQPGGPAINPLQQQGGRPQDINAGPFGAEPNIGAPAAQPPPPPAPGIGPGGAAATPPAPGAPAGGAAVPPPPPPGDNP
jgi:hypothetical protein